MKIRIVLRALHRPILVACLLGPSAGCAHHADAVTVREVREAVGLRHGLEIDTTRISRGTGLPPVAAVTRLLEENLLAFFRLMPTSVPATEMRSEILAEATAPGYGVRVVVEARPDAFCHVSIEVVTMKEGRTETAQTAPYSVHYAVSGVRGAMVGLRGPNRPPLGADRFDTLRKQATELRARGTDPAIDEAEFARTPRPLERLDEAPRYYAPVDSPSTVRPE